ncbi:MAG: translation factor GTPase family protein [Christensenellales bacterium]|nr:translation factor GTPase family protein [Christensenellales bacterium]
MEGKKGTKSIPTRCIGVLAHVDAGKTTLSEQILYQTGVLRVPGRVDHGSAALDFESVERERGITVFSGQAIFEFKGCRYTLIDTPGHVDFAPETERALDALDGAVLVVDASGRLMPHAVMLARMARNRGIPLLIFMNKCDLATADPRRVLDQLGDMMEGTPLMLPCDPEQVAELDEVFLEVYLEGRSTEADMTAALRRGFCSGAVLPVICGSALNGTGIDALLDAIHMLLSQRDQEGVPGEEFKAKVYKIRYDEKGQRVVFMRILSGSLHPRDAFVLDGETEKVQEIRIYQGKRYTSVPEANRGDAVGVTGLVRIACGDRLEERDGIRRRVGGGRYCVSPALATQISVLDGTSDALLMEKLRRLGEEDPALGVRFDPRSGKALVQVTGQVQLEVLERLMGERFGIRIGLMPPEVIYRETIDAPVMGWGHYEPLRHYAEVGLRLEPAPRGTGIVFESECHVDVLPAHYQNLIRTHVFERVHRGILTGSELTDVRVVLISGHAHDKHTEGGDFREATYRAIRQGLMQAQSVLLEPWYRFEIMTPGAYVGKVLCDLAVMSASFEAPRIYAGETVIRGRGPVATMADYAVTLREITHGEGDVMLYTDGYELCHNPDAVCARVGYDPEADTEQPSSSVFCAHGAGFVVKWCEAQSMMHGLR